MNRQSPGSTDAPVPFWRRKTLAQMTEPEWESLCDGCGKCCVHKLEDDASGAVVYTNVACKLLDRNSCRCSDYRHRKLLVPDCVHLTPSKAQRLSWLPETCAYRLVANRQPLADWHPLISGDPDSVHAAGISVRGKVISEQDAGPMENHVTDEIF